MRSMTRIEFEVIAQEDAISDAAACSTSVLDRRSLMVAASLPPATMGPPVGRLLRDHRMDHFSSQ